MFKKGKKKYSEYRLILVGRNEGNYRFEDQLGMHVMGSSNVEDFIWDGHSGDNELVSSLVNHILAIKESESEKERLVKTVNDFNEALINIKKEGQI